MRIDEQFDDKARELKERIARGDGPAGRRPVDGEADRQSPGREAYTLDDEADEVVDRIISEE